MRLQKLTVRTILVGLLALGLQGLLAQSPTQTRDIRLTPGEMRDLAVPFSIKSFEPGNHEIVRAQRSSVQIVTVTGLKEGRTDLKVVGEADQTETFKITVGSSVDAYLVEIRKDLEKVPSLEAEIAPGGTISIRGVVTKPEQWAYLKKIIQLPPFKDLVVNKATFHFQDELLLKLKTDLEREHFKVLEANAKAPEGKASAIAPGTLVLHSSDNNVFLNGSVNSHGELNTIKTIISSCPWLRIRRDEKDADDACYAVLNVTVAPVMLEVDVSFIGVTDAEATTLGANLLRNGLAAVNGVAQIGGSALNVPRGSGQWTVSGSMNETIKAISGGDGVGPARFKKLEHLTIRNDSTNWNEFKDGGTLEIPVSGGLTGTAGLSPIPYGLVLKVKGGLADANTAALDLRVEMSVPVIKGVGASGPIYDKQETSLDSAVYCPVGKTCIMGGTKQLTEGLNISSATPILGKIPLLQFLFSERTKTKTDRQVLILVSPQIARNPEAAAPLVEQTADTQDKVNKPISILRPKY